MACLSCQKTATNDEATQTKILSEAQTLANRERQWVIIFRDESGQLQYSLYEFAVGVKPEYVVTPNKL